MNETMDQLRMDAHAQLTLLRKAVERISPDDHELAVLDGMLEKVKSHPYSLAVVGEFNRGKSSLINALLGMPVLPADVTPTTATINRVVYADSPCAKLCMHDGSEEALPIQMLKARVTKLSEEATAASRQVREAVIGYPTVFCKGNISILDTPGLNESPDMDALTLSYARNVDAVVFLISALVPYSISEAEAVCRLLTRSNIRHILFTVSFIDRVQDVPGNEEKIIASIKKRITKVTLPIIEANEELSAEEKERQRSLLQNAAVLGVSAKKALDAFVNGSMEDLRLSRIETYKTELMARLTAQQNEWLARDILPYLNQTAAVFDQVVRRRVLALEERIQTAQAHIAQGRQRLLSIGTEEKAIINAWSTQVRNELIQRSAWEEKLKQIMRTKMEEDEDDQPAASDTPLADAFHAGMGSGMMRWIKKKATDAGIYRDSSDIEQQLLRGGYEQARDAVVNDWLPSLQAGASKSYRAAYSQCNALCNAISDSLRQAAAALETELEIPALSLAPDADILLFESAAVRELQALPFPLWASVDKVEHVVPRLAGHLSGKLAEKLQAGTAKIRETRFPDSSAFCSLRLENAARLDSVCAELKQTLDDLKAEALSLQRLVGSISENPEGSSCAPGEEHMEA